MAFRPARLSYDDIRRLAAMFLDEFHQERTVPVPIEEIVEFDFEIEVIPIDGILDDLRVDAFLTSDLKSIYVDEFVMTHRHGRFRFSLAHEIGHHELHRSLYEETDITSVQSWRTVQSSITEEAYLWFEFQANAFAGLVLVPPPELKREYADAVSAAAVAGISQETLASEPGRDYIAQSLAATFQVSTEVIRRRMEKDGFWPSAQFPVPPVRPPKKRR